jgi:hypothetical protein
MQRAATVPTRSSEHQRNDNSLMNHGTSYSHRHDGVNNTSSHRNHYHQLQYPLRTS